MSQIYFSSMPRDFPHQQNAFLKTPLELNGDTVKRLDKDTNTQGQWDKLIERTEEFVLVTKP
jgi:hypothetical protein